MPPDADISVNSHMFEELYKNIKFDEMDEIPKTASSLSETRYKV